jgi:K+-sensing histidine kinase KdpD
LLATLAYNFCFTEPVFTLHVDSPENVVALAFFGRGLGSRRAVTHC